MRQYSVRPYPRQRPPSTSHDPGRPGRVLLAACLGYGMVVIDISIVNVAIPAIRESLHASLASMQLVIAAYGIVLASLVVAGASVVARFGAPAMFRLGIGIFGAASVLCAAAPDPAILVAMRVLQGGGAILLSPATLVMLTEAYPSGDARAKAFAVWATVAGSPVAFAPIVGGALVSAIGWRSIFLINVPLVIGILWLTARHMPANRRGAHGERQDVLGQILAALTLGGIALALTYGQQSGWGRPLPRGAALVAGLALIAFVVRQRTFEFPVLAADLLRAPGFGRYVTIGLLLFAGYYGLVFVISVFLQDVHGYGPVLTGVSFLPSALPITLAPLLGGRLNARLGPRRLLACACAITLAGALELAAVGSDGPLALSIGLFAIGLGFGLATVPQITLAMASAPGRRAALASGVLTAGRQSGTTIGVALVGGLQAGRTMAVPCLVAGAIYLLMLGAAAGGRARVPS